MLNSNDNSRPSKPGRVGKRALSIAHAELATASLVGKQNTFAHPTQLVGSETRAGAMLYVYAGYPIVVLAALSLRIRLIGVSKTPKLIR
jgi:hypothetical protein